MNLVGATILIILIFVVLMAPRRWALVGMMTGVLYLTQEQQIVLLGLHLFAVRLLEVAGILRVVSRREFSFAILNNLDRALIWLYGFTTIVFLLRSSVDQVFAIGLAVDAFFCYFTFRGLVKDMEDFRWFLRVFIFLLVPYALLVMVESRTGHNFFSTILGGAEGDDVRHGRARCIGSFRQPDLLGMFAASFLPLYIGFACIKQDRKYGIIGICLCLIIAWTANSGGTAAAVAMGILGWLFWRWRTKMRHLRWGIVGLFAVLAVIMKAPIWYVFAHISSVTGGDGWHRSYLMDVAYQHLGQWWFAGMSYTDTKNWFPYSLSLTGTADITNQFISFGLAAGLGGIILFILLLKRAFGNLGKAMTVIRENSEKSREAEFLLWSLGVMLVIHIIDWFGITYFDQMYVVWFMQLALISSLSEQFIARESALLPKQAEPEVEIDEMTQLQPDVSQLCPSV